MRKAIILDDFLGLQVLDGSLMLGDPTRQNQRLFIISDKAEIKSAPIRGIGARRLVELGSPDLLARETRLEFFADGQTVNQIKVKDSELSVDAFYPENQ